MVDIRRIFEATPVVRLEAQEIVSVYGLAGLVPSWVGRQPRFDPFEPPAARREPFADAVEFLSMLRISEGIDASEARAEATEMWRNLRVSLSALDRPMRLDESNLLGDTEMCSVRTLLTAAEERGLATSAQLMFWDRVLFAVEDSRIYPPADEGGARRLRELPDAPVPWDLFEFVCSLPLDIRYALEPESEWVPRSENRRFIEWREGIRPVAQRLEEALGSWVWHFADLDDDSDDDAGHRLLVLHMLTSLLPQSPFVGYMMEVSGAATTDALLAALVDPASYFLPFEPNDGFCRDDVKTVAVHAGSITAPKCVGLVADSESALFRLRERALARIGGVVCLVLPPGSADAAWCAEATRHNLDSSVHYGWDGALAFLADTQHVTVLFDSDAGLSDSGRRLGLELRRLGKSVAAVGTNGWTYNDILYR